MMHVSSRSICLLLWMASFISGLDAGFKLGFLPKIFDYSYFQREYQKSNSTDNTYRSKLFLGQTLGIFKHNILFLQRKSNYYLTQNAMTDLTPDEIAKQQGSGPDFDLKPVIEAEEFGGLPANFLKSIQKITESDATGPPPSDKQASPPGLDGLGRAINQMNEDYMTIETVGRRTKQPSTIATPNTGIESESHAVKVSKIADPDGEEKIEHPSDQIRSSYSSSVGNLLGIGGSGDDDDGDLSEIEKALERMDDEDYMRPGAAILPVVPESDAVARKISDPKIVKVSKIDDSNEGHTNEHSVEQLMASFSNSVENLLHEDDERIKKDPGQVMNPETVVSQAPIKYRIDWRITGCIGRPRAQGTCNACYIFATLDLLEYFYCRQTGNRAEFSRQHVLDCGTELGAIKGCQGGRLSEVGKFVRSHGLRFESSHPFTGKHGECKSLRDDNDQPATVVMPDIINWQLFNSITAWYTWARKSPIIVGINMPSDFHVYGGGIHDGRNCQINETHAMLLVGYGSQDGLEFWLLKNSFSEDWGETGYFRLSKDAPLNCFGSAIVARAAFD